MLNFDEQTGIGAVIVVWLFLTTQKYLEYINIPVPYIITSMYPLIKVCISVMVWQ